MILKLKAFATTTLMGHNIPMLTTGGKVFKAHTVMHNDDPEFGAEFKRPHTHSTPMFGVVYGMAPTEDMKGYKVTVIITDQNFQPLAEDTNAITTFEVAADTLFAEGVWTDNKENVVDLCERSNKESIAGMKKLMDVLQAKIDYNRKAAGITKEALEDCLKESNESTILVGGKKSAKDDYFVEKEN